MKCLGNKDSRYKRHLPDAYLEGNLEPPADDMRCEIKEQILEQLNEEERRNVIVTIANYNIKYERVLSGSPRKGGNTDQLVQAFVEGAEKNNTVEVFSIEDYKVNPCIGCNTCFERNGHACFQQDDMQIIYEKLKSADVFVIASPVYFYGVSAQLKAVIDRLHTPMRNEFTIKKLALILVGAATLPELFDAIKVQYQMVLNFFKLEDAGMVLVRDAKDKGDVRNTDGLKEAYELGKTIM